MYKVITSIYRLGLNSLRTNAFSVNTNTSIMITRMNAMKLSTTKATKSTKSKKEVNENGDTEKKPRKPTAYNLFVKEVYPTLSSTLKPTVLI